MTSASEVAVATWGALQVLYAFAFDARRPVTFLALEHHCPSTCTKLTRSCYYQLHQFRPIIPLLSTESTRTLVQAFISCRLDYCNSLVYDISNRLRRRLQSVQNATARLVTGMNTLHRYYVSWIGHRFVNVFVSTQLESFKLAGFVFQSLAVVLAPPYSSPTTAL